MTKPVALVDKYIFGLLLQTIVFSIALFTVIWLCPETLFKLIQYVFSEQLTLSQAGTMLLYHIPPVLQQSMPIAVMMGSIFLFRRLSMNSEMVALLAAGISPRRLLWSVLWMGILFGGLHFAVQEWVTPVTAPKLEALYQGYGLKQKKDDNFVYVEKNQLGQLDKFILIGQTPKNHLKDFLFLYYHPSTDGGVQISRILRAPEGRWSPQEKAWQLFNGIDYELDSEGVYHDIRRFSEQWVSTSKYPAKLLEFSKINPLSMKLGTIKEYIDLLKEGGQFQDVRFSEVSFFQKILFPLGTLLFALIGAVLGTEKVRTNGNLGIIYGAVVLFLYSILIPFSTNVGSIGIIPPLLAAILPLSVCLAGFWLIATFKRVQT